MPSKQFALDAQTTITIYKRKSSRHLRLSIDPKGAVRVSIPMWASYQSGLRFARSRLDWIHQQQKDTVPLQTEQHIGKTHTLHLLPSAGSKRATSRVLQQKILVKYPALLPATDPSVQQAAEAACVRALRKEAETLLPERLAVLAAQHGYQYKTVAIKRLKSRWGSCDQQANIILNVFLIQLPWDCIDYVLLHELTHTQFMNHSPNFWDQMKAVEPRVSAIRKRMRGFQPILQSTMP